MSASVAQCYTPSMGVMNMLVTMLVKSIYDEQCKISPSEYWPEDYGPKVSSNGLENFDFVVVGSGSAGSVVASRLSENPNYNVLVLEAGGNPSQETEVPNLLFAIQLSDYMYNYYNEPSNKSCKAFKNNQCYWPRGKGIGGSGSVSDMLYYTGNRGEYDNWLAAGNTGWGFDQVRPYFEKSTRPVGNETHPQGYLPIDDFPTFDEDVLNMLFDGANSLGLPKVKDFTEGSYIGYGKTKGTVQNGHRTSTGKGHLGKVSKRPNLKVVKNAQVTKVNLDSTGKNVVSLSFVLQGTKQFTVKAKKEFILSAGSVDTPKILMLSGVGPKQVLQPLGIPVKHELPIGKNLQDHLFTIVFLGLDGTAPDEKQTLDSIYEYIIHTKGPLTSTSTASLTGFIRTDPKTPASPYPDTTIHHALIRMGDTFRMNIVLNGLVVKDELRAHIMKEIQKHDMVILLIYRAHPKSKGEITLKSSSYKDAPRINANYLDEPEDVTGLLRGIQHYMRMEKTPAFKKKNAQILHIPIKECDQYSFKSDDYWKCYISYFSSTVYHPVGTVKMGAASDPTSCVNPRLKLKGVTNLRVIDASVMPIITSVNVNGPTVMIAEKASDMIIEDWTKK